MKTRHWIIAAGLLWVVVIVVECLALWNISPFGGRRALNVWGGLLVIWVFALIKASPGVTWRWVWRLAPPLSLLLPAALLMATR